MDKKLKNTASAGHQIKFSNNKLFADLSELIGQSRHQVAMQANSTLTILFWQVGKCINEDILHNQRAAYGKQIVPAVSAQLENVYGRNFAEKNVRRMMQFADIFQDMQFVVTLSRQLTWSHFLVLIPLKSFEAKEFYAHLAINETLGVRELRKQIASKIFERTEVAGLPPLPDENFSVNTFKDPYLLDFLGLQNDDSETDMKTAILHELEKFILELGKGFAFVERQKRIITDGEDFYLDLLFFHRSLRRLVAVDLKLGKLQAKHKTQMEAYLNWLNKNGRQEGEEMPIALILCAESNKVRAELLKIGEDEITVAECWMKLPPKKELERKLLVALIDAKERFERKKLI